MNGEDVKRILGGTNKYILGQSSGGNEKQYQKCIQVGKRHKQASGKGNADGRALERNW